MRCELSPLAEADLIEIGDYIAQNNPVRAETFVAELLDQAHKIAQMPTAYPAREALLPGPRSCAYRRYILFFRATENAVRIERVLHSARDIGADEFSAQGH